MADGRVRAIEFHGTVDDSRGDEITVSRAYLRNALHALLAGVVPDTPPQGCFVTWRPRAAVASA